MVKILLVSCVIILVQISEARRMKVDLMVSQLFSKDQTERLNMANLLSTQDPIYTKHLDVESWKEKYKKNPNLPKAAYHAVSILKSYANKDKKCESDAFKLISRWASNAHTDPYYKENKILGLKGDYEKFGKHLLSTYNSLMEVPKVITKKNPCLVQISEKKYLYKRCHSHPAMPMQSADCVSGEFKIKKSKGQHQLVQIKSYGTWRRKQN